MIRALAFSAWATTAAFQIGPPPAVPASGCAMIEIAEDGIVTIDWTCVEYAATSDGEGLEVQIARALLAVRAGKALERSK